MPKPDTEPKTSYTPQEVQAIIDAAQAKVAELEKERDDLRDQNMATYSPEAAAAVKRLEGKVDALEAILQRVGGELKVSPAKALGLKGLIDELF